MSYRTNRKTGGVFVVPTARLGAFQPLRHMVPKETRHYAKVAKLLGLKVRFEILPLSKLRSRGLLLMGIIGGYVSRNTVSREHLF